MTSRLPPVSHGFRYVSSNSNLPNSSLAVASSISVTLSMWGMNTFYDIISISKCMCTVAKHNSYISAGQDVWDFPRLQRQTALCASPTCCVSIKFIGLSQSHPSPPFVCQESPISVSLLPITPGFLHITYPLFFSNDGCTSSHSRSNTWRSWMIWPCPIILNSCSSFKSNVFFVFHCSVASSAPRSCPGHQGGGFECNPVLLWNTALYLYPTVLLEPLFSELHRYKSLSTWCKSWSLSIQEERLLNICLYNRMISWVPCLVWSGLRICFSISWIWLFSSATSCLFFTFCSLWMSVLVMFCLYL